MKRRKWTALLPAFSAALGLSACVNINVNIPAGAVQEASDDYVSELYKAKENKEKQKETPAAKPASPSGAILDLFLPSARADETVTIQPIRTNSDKAVEIRARQRARLPELQKRKAAGLLGESSDGMLVFRGKGEEEASLKKLVDDENQDREELYGEVVSHNSLKKGHLVDIRQSFARSFQKFSPPRTWIQSPDGAWSQKR